MDTTVLGLIVVPLAIFLLGAAYAGIRGTIRFAQYLVRSEEAQASMAKSNQVIADRLDEYMGKTDGEIRSLDRRVSIVEYAVTTSAPPQNGRRHEG